MGCERTNPAHADHVVLAHAGSNTCVCLKREIKSP